MEIKIIKINTSDFFYDIPLNFAYNDELIITKNSMSYERRSFIENSLIYEWSYKTCSDFFYNNFLKVCEQINEINFDEKSFEMSDVGSFVICVEYADGTKKQRSYSYNLSFNELDKLADAICRLRPNCECLSGLVEPTPSKPIEPGKIVYSVIGGVLFKSVDKKYDYMIYRSQHDSWEATDYEHGDLLPFPEAKILKEEEALQYALELGMSKEEFYKE